MITNSLFLTLFIAYDAQLHRRNFILCITQNPPLLFFIYTTFRKLAKIAKSCV